jgi:hypothetical protein
VEASLRHLVRLLVAAAVVTGVTVPAVTATAAPATKPAAPSNVTAVAGNAQATVSWTAPANDGGSAITGYTATSQPDGHICTSTGDVTSCTVTGLTNGTSYRFVVQAANAVGLLPNSPQSNAVIPLAPPQAPGTVTATAGNAQVVVGWHAPSAAVSNAQVTGYVVAGSPGGGCTAPSAATQCTVTGLTNGTSYTFTVVATSASGPSPASEASPAVVPAGPPGQPTGVAATPGDAQAMVSWNAPANGGSVITGYSVLSTPQNLTCTTTTATSCAVAGLTNGTTYTFAVTAINGIGPGVPSSPSNAVTPAAPPTKPAAPTSVTATAGNAQATVSWTAPAQDGGAAISSYTVTSTPEGKTCTTATTSCTVTGLTNGTQYRFTVTATNSVGTGPASAQSNPVTPTGPPGPPTGVTATAGNGEATVSWTAPSSNGGSPITGYTVTSSTGAKSCSTTTATTCTITGLTNGTSYTFTVTAANSAGTGPASAASAAVTPEAPATAPGAPTDVQASAGDGQATVTWTPPANNGGKAITGYTVISSPGNRQCTTTGATSCTITGLTDGTSYTFTVTASNPAGTGPASAPSNAVTPLGPPAAPTGVSAVAGNASATVTWKAPTVTGGSSITGYMVTASPGGATCTTTGATSCTVTGLTNGTSYTFTVVATSEGGTGPASAASPAVTPSGPSGPPTDVIGTPANHQVTVSWTAPATSAATAPVTGYVVTSQPESAGCTTSGATSCVVTDLTDGTAYTFTVVAKGAAGSSTPSAASAAVTPVGPPGAPQRIRVTAGDSQVMVRWRAAAAHGSPITGYAATADPGGFTCTTGGATSCTITGLADGTAYSISVTATNAAGSGAAGSAKAPVTPAGPPSAPTGLQITPGHHSLTISWSAPLNTGGAPITGYQLQWSACPLYDTCARHRLGTQKTTLAISPLQPGRHYYIRVRAKNAVGPGVFTKVNKGTPAAR